MHANDTNNANTKLIYPELSYLVVGVCFRAHNDTGRFSREEQCGDALEKLFSEIRIPFRRECRIGDSGSVVDFVLDGKIALEIKTKRVITPDDYRQVQRYLQAAGLKFEVGTSGKFQERLPSSGQNRTNRDTSQESI